MKHRKLRIAWSVAWGVVAVLPVVLWVRSYSYFHFLDRTVRAKNISFHSHNGRLVFALQDSPYENLDWYFDSGPARPHIFLEGEKPNTYRGLNFRSESDGYSVCVPYWSLLLPTATVSYLAWLPLRF